MIVNTQTHNNSNNNNRMNFFRFYTWLTLWGLGTWNYISPGDWVHFGDFLIFFNETSLVNCHGSQFSSLFTIVQELMAPGLQCNIFFCSTKWMLLWMMSQWCHQDVTIVGHIGLSLPLRGMTYMSFQSSKG